MSLDSCSARWSGCLAAITLPREIDAVNSGDVLTALLRAIADGATALVADLSGTEFCACAGLHALACAHHQAVATGAELRVVPGPAVQRMIDLVGVHDLHVYPSLTAALDGLPRAVPLPAWISDPAGAP